MDLKIPEIRVSILLTERQTNAWSIVGFGAPLYTEVCRLALFRSLDEVDDLEKTLGRPRNLTCVTVRLYSCIKFLETCARCF